MNTNKDYVINDFVYAEKVPIDAFECYCRSFEENFVRKNFENVDLCLIQINNILKLSNTDCLYNIIRSNNIISYLLTLIKVEDDDQSDQRRTEYAFKIIKKLVERYEKLTFELLRVDVIGVFLASIYNYTIENLTNCFEVLTLMHRNYLFPKEMEDIVTTHIMNIFNLYLLFKERYLLNDDIDDDYSSVLEAVLCCFEALVVIFNDIKNDDSPVICQLIYSEMKTFIRDKFYSELHHTCAKICVYILTKLRLYDSEEIFSLIRLISNSGSCNKTIHHIYYQLTDYLFKTYSTDNLLMKKAIANINYIQLKTEVIENNNIYFSDAIVLIIDIINLGHIHRLYEYHIVEDLFDNFMSIQTYSRKKSLLYLISLIVIESNDKHACFLHYMVSHGFSFDIVAKNFHILSRPVETKSLFLASIRLLQQTHDFQDTVLEEHIYDFEEFDDSFKEDYDVYVNMLLLIQDIISNRKQN